MGRDALLKQRHVFRAAERTTDVRFGRGLFAGLPSAIAERRPTSVAVVSDDRVAAHWGQPLVERLGAIGMRVHALIFPAGEIHKTRETKRLLEDALLDAGADRSVLVVNVGGGVVCDVGGFVAATWQRGVPTWHVPTSLLAMVDAALGGKVGVNLPGAKNMVGAFWQPERIVADPETLATLPDEEFRRGLAEVVKSAAIADADLFERLEREADALLARRPETVDAVVERCLAIKGAFVVEDEREAGRRAALNFGHTVAHALEAVTGHRLPHGEAVAIGLCVEARIAGCEPDRIEALLGMLGLPTRVPDGVDRAALVEAARRDKKATGGRLVCALPEALGRMPAGAVVREVSEETLLAAT